MDLVFLENCVGIYVLNTNFHVIITTINCMFLANKILFE